MKKSKIRKKIAKVFVSNRFDFEYIKKSDSFRSRGKRNIVFIIYGNCLQYQIESTGGIFSTYEDTISNNSVKEAVKRIKKGILEIINQSS